MSFITILDLFILVRHGWEVWTHRYHDQLHTWLGSTIIQACPYFIHFDNYSWTSLYRTRIIWTSTYIEVGLWSRPPAIIKGRKRHRIYWTWLYQSLGYIEYAAVPSHVHEVVYIKVKHVQALQWVPRSAMAISAAAVSWLAICVTRHLRTVSSRRSPTVTAADALSHLSGYDWLLLQSVQWS